MKTSLQLLVSCADANNISVENANDWACSVFKKLTAVFYVIRLQNLCVMPYGKLRNTREKMEKTVLRALYHHHHHHQQQQQQQLREMQSL